jgi:hypothetical protein
MILTLLGTRISSQSEAEKVFISTTQIHFLEEQKQTTTIVFKNNETNSC